MAAVIMTLCCYVLYVLGENTTSSLKHKFCLLLSVFISAVLCMLCDRAILSELREHSEAWPFLTPVNTKQFPTYRKVIRCPVDFQTIGRKLKTNT